MHRRIILTVGGLAVLAVLLVVGLSQSPGKKQDIPAFTLSAQAVQQRLAGAPAKLAELHVQANQLIKADTRAFKARIASLKGTPIVINKWASWCGPCRVEFPLFQQAGVEYGKRVAFLGVNSGDFSDGAAARFLKRFPLSYPSYVDPKEKLATAIGAPANYPITVFYNAAGERAFVHQGYFSSTDAIDAAIDRYALGEKPSR